MHSLELASIQELRVKCPLKWHERIPDGGAALGIADIDFYGPRTVHDFLKTHLDKAYEFYQPFSGLPTAVNAGISFLRERGVKYPSHDQIQVIPGTMLGIFVVMEWASRQHKEILLIDPLYPPIIKHAQAHGKVKFLHLDEEKHWRLDEEALKHSVSRETGLLALVNPNNPTGTLYHENELKLIADLAQDYDFTVFTDELYEPLIHSSTHHLMGRFNELQGRLISLYGFSKAYGLAGYRSGFMYLNHEQKEDIKAIVESLLVSPSPFTSFLMEYALEDSIAQEWKRLFAREMKETTRFATKFLQDHGLHVIQPEGTFFVFPKINVPDNVFTEYLLQKKGVQVVPGSEFGLAGKEHVRINCATSIERLEHGLSLFLQGLREFQE